MELEKEKLQQEYEALAYDWAKLKKENRELNKKYSELRTKNQLVHDEDFINMKLKDKIVTHLGVNHFNGLNGILIKCI